MKPLRHYKPKVSKLTNYFWDKIFPWMLVFAMLALLLISFLWPDITVFGK